MGSGEGRGLCKQQEHGRTAEEESKMGYCEVKVEVEAEVKDSQPRSMEGSAESSFSPGVKLGDVDDPSSMLAAYRNGC
jgi:hypothetical protein